MSEYIRTNKFDMNECPNIFVKEKLIRTNVRIYIRDQYIRIFEYSNIFVTLWYKRGKKSTKEIYMTRYVRFLYNHEITGNQYLNEQAQRCDSNLQSETMND